VSEGEREDRRRRDVGEGRWWQSVAWRGEQIILEASMSAQPRSTWPETLEEVEGGIGGTE
jgi:hypothetical protein